MARQIFTLLTDTDVPFVAGTNDYLFPNAIGAAFRQTFGPLFGGADMKFSPDTNVLLNRIKAEITGISGARIKNEVANVLRIDLANGAGVSYAWKIPELGVWQDIEFSLPAGGTIPSYLTASGLGAGGAFYVGFDSFRVQPEFVGYPMRLQLQIEASFAGDLLP